MFLHYHEKVASIKFKIIPTVRSGSNFIPSVRLVRFENIHNQWNSFIGHHEDYCPAAAVRSIRIGLFKLDGVANLRKQQVYYGFNTLVIFSNHMQEFL